ncbi:hypothetical protein [Neobacillus niacini]|uniref:hypothetical protein n=1 Tax=Neobacillus niacini TaxID=86668 RepID=UPI001C8DB282|nr:hypothetical protein [Neobacillus niacini]MBY0144990.1 hypothetical protein [Neobacillus niacini]
MEYKKYWDLIYQKNTDVNALYSDYWKEFSHLGTWQFWVVLALLVIPLLVLFFTVDRKRIFELFFFGYTIHILWTYIDIALGRNGYFVHHYFLTPSLPNAANMTASVLPVGFLLLYQYCTNKQKNFYLYTLIVSACFAFIFASIEQYMGFVEFRKGMNQFYLFLIDIVIVVSSYWFTKFILRVKNGGNS